MTGARRTDAGIGASVQRAARGALRTVHRQGRRVLGLALTFLLRRRGQDAAFSAADVRSVLVCRINGRIGNTLFLTPLIEQLRQSFSQATLDLALACPQAPELLTGAPGVRRIVLVPDSGLSWLWRYPAAIWKLRRERYDLAIDPTVESTSGRLALSLCRARYRAGFAGAHQWARLTHAVAPPKEMMHEAQRPVFLLRGLLREPFEPRTVRLQVWLSAAERNAGRSLLTEAVGAERARRLQTFGCFTHAAGAKTVPSAWWIEFWSRFCELEPGALPLEFLPSPQARALDPRWPALHVGDLRALAGAIEAGRLFMSTDSGPLHLGSATNVPTVGLFHATDPALYRPLKPYDLVVDPSAAVPAEAAQRCSKLWRSAESASGPWRAAQNAGLEGALQAGAAG